MSCAWSLDKLINQMVRLSGLFRKHMFGCFIEDQHGIDTATRWESTTSPGNATTTGTPRNSCYDAGSKR
ncbi:hypothetical protein BJF87_20505 [Gordonia sp. CNJ-863]|uniref:Uncharacterized protein n=1 Tax=Gordonia alkanivorans CGMCC 6845 TaxID=1423140 RepID=W9D8G3_9ACTN|nr:hypothetical protein V525_19020 [Gordonia alkanivorans CGMCC 6845]OLT48316.1 hypothetical protein BJF87_20505 [Gordonia sp. CNJ-863]